MSDSQTQERPVGPLIGYGNLMFKHRNWVFPIVMVVLFLGFKPVWTGGTPASDGLGDLAGLLVAFLGAALRVTVVGLVYIKRGGMEKKVYADDLVTEGMFSHGRNPLYVGNLLVIIGMLIIHNSPWVYLLGGGYFIISYIAIVAAEEHYLRGRFAEQYDDYARTTPRWGIKLAGLGATLSQHTFRWKRVIAKEYTTLATTALMILVLLAAEAVTEHGLSDQGPLNLILGCMVLVGVVTLAIRVLKKSGRFQE